MWLSSCQQILWPITGTDLSLIILNGGGDVFRGMQFYNYNNQKVVKPSPTLPDDHRWIILLLGLQIRGRCPHHGPQLPIHTHTTHPHPVQVHAAQQDPHGSAAVAHWHPSQVHRNGCMGHQ